VVPGTRIANHEAKAGCLMPKMTAVVACFRQYEFLLSETRKQF
jgi:hypothetical protein